MEHVQANQPFQNLIPDCLLVIFDFYLHKIPGGSTRAEQESKSVSPYNSPADAAFALKHIRRWDFYSVVNEATVKRHLLPDNVTQEILSSNNIVELRINQCPDLTVQAIDHLKSLEILELEGCSSIQDEVFCGMSHLRELEIPFCSQLTDAAIENLYNAGSRLRKLNITFCMKMTDRALSFLEGIEDLYITHCPQITDAGLRHVKGSLRSISFDNSSQVTTAGFENFEGVEHLSIDAAKNINCHKAFKFLEGSIQYLFLDRSELNSIDAKSFRYLKGIRCLSLSESVAKRLRDDAFQYLTGIETLDLSGSELDKLSKNCLFYLTGIESLHIERTGLRIEATDLPKLKKVFENICRLIVDEDFAEPSVLAELKQFVERNGGKMMIEDDEW